MVLATTASKLHPFIASFFDLASIMKKLGQDHVHCFYVSGYYQQHIRGCFFYQYRLGWIIGSYFQMRSKQNLLNFFD
jgi:hypothetical protein